MTVTRSKTTRARVAKSRSGEALVPVAERRAAKRVEHVSAMAALVVVALLIGMGLWAYGTAPVDIGALGRDWQWYAAPDDGFRIRYPEGWSSERYVTNEGGVPVASVVLASDRERIVIYSGGPVIEAGLFPDATRSFTIHGLPATQYRDADPVTGMAVDRVVIKTPTRAYELRGSGPAFRSVVMSFRLLPSEVN